MPRETKEITTTGGHKVVINTYLTGRESNEAKAVIFQGISVEAGASEKPKVPLSNMPIYERKVLEMLVVSFDGSTEKVVDQIENLPSAEYDAIVAQIKNDNNAFLGATK